MYIYTQTHTQKHLEGGRIWEYMQNALELLEKNLPCGCMFYFFEI